MRTTVDRAGRVVIPKSLRDALRLTDGAAVEIRLEEGRILLEPAPVTKKVVDGPHGVVLRADEGVPRLTVDEVRVVLEDLRR